MFLRTLSALLLTMPGGVALAAAGNPLTDRFSVSLGAFFIGTSTDVRIDGTGGRGTEFNVERELGFDDTDRFRVEGYWRFWNRHKIRALWFDTDRNSTRTLDETLQVGNSVFPIQATVNAHFNTQIAELAYEFAFLRRDTFELGASIGVHHLSFDLGITASASSTGTEVGTSQTTEADGPLPVVGLSGIWRISDRFYLNGQAQYFQISIDPYDGNIQDYNLSIVWSAMKHVAFGIGFNKFIMHVNVEADRYDGSLRWHYQGGRAFVTASF